MQVIMLHLDKSALAGGGRLNRVVVVLSLCLAHVPYIGLLRELSVFHLLYCRGLD